ncbi:MAG: hypothetical protein ACLUD2_06825 [Clostridium sp.]
MKHGVISCILTKRWQSITFLYKRYAGDFRKLGAKPDGRWGGIPEAYGRSASGSFCPKYSGKLEELRTACEQADGTKLDIGDVGYEFEAFRRCTFA